MDFDEISYTSIEKSKLRSLQNLKHRKIICQYNATLFASDIYCNWNNLKLNGFLTFEIDYEKKNRYFCLYEINTLELLFQYELYINLEKHLNLCESNFLSFEVDKGFIGMQFIYDNEAISFKIFVTKFTQEYTLKIIEKKSYDYSPEYSNSHLIKSRDKILFDIYIDLIKKKYKKESIYHENVNIAVMNFNQIENEEENKSIIDDYQEEKIKLKSLMEVFGNITIKKIKNLDLILNIDFCPKIKKFNIDNIPQEIKKVLNKNGIKKHQFTNSIFALGVFKNFIENYDKNTGYFNFFGRFAVKDIKKRKALDWVGLIRKGKVRDSALASDSATTSSNIDNKNKSNKETLLEIKEEKDELNEKDDIIINESNENIIIER
jgi:hypothetical protein